MKSRSLLTLLLLVVALQFVRTAASPQEATAVDSSSSRNASTRNNSTSPTITVSFCDLCRKEGKCDQAYHGKPGMFCGSPHSRRMACCCPANGVCLRVESPHECACGSGSGRSNAQHASVKDQQDKNNSGSGFGVHKIAWTVTGALVLCVLIAMYLYSMQPDSSSDYRAPRGTARARDALPVTPPWVVSAAAGTKAEARPPRPPAVTSSV